MRRRAEWWELPEGRWQITRDARGVPVRWLMHRTGVVFTVERKEGGFYCVTAKDMADFGGQPARLDGSACWSLDGALRACEEYAEDAERAEAI